MTDKNEKYDYVPGYCLNTMNDTDFFWPKGINGALFTCPYCGKITDESSGMHIFNPSEKLVSILNASNTSTDKNIKIYNGIAYIPIHGLTNPNPPKSYDTSIHTNPDAMAWAKFFAQYYAFPDNETMMGWFANAMMAQHDSDINKNALPVSQEELVKMAEYIRLSVRTLNAIVTVPERIREIYEIAGRIIESTKKIT
jgi:hypothetical protein